MEGYDEGFQTAMRGSAYSQSFALFDCYLIRPQETALVLVSFFLRLRDRCSAPLWDWSKVDSLIIVKK